MVPYCHVPTPPIQFIPLSKGIPTHIRGTAHRLAQTSALCHAQTHICITNPDSQRWARPFLMNPEALRTTKQTGKTNRSYTALEVFLKASRTSYEFHTPNDSSGVKRLQSFYDNNVRRR